MSLSLSCIPVPVSIALLAILASPASGAEIPFGSEQVVTSTADSARVAVAADVDGDGDLDLVAASLADDTIAWYENTDGQGSFALGLTVSATVDGAIDVFAADVDSDGDVDLISAGSVDSTIRLHRNLDGLGGSWADVTISTVSLAVKNVVAADLDSDGDLDVLAASQNDDTVAWYRNEDGSGSVWSEVLITQLADGAVSVFAGDVDGDGDLDALAAAFDDNQVWWRENDGAGSFVGSQLVTNVLGPSHVVGADIDGDGDLDAVVTGFDGGSASWHENIDGQGGFPWTVHVITTTLPAARSVVSADMDADGDLDVLLTSVADDEIAWYENLDGAGTFGSIKTISTAADAAFWATPADLDGDGDLDVVAASFNDDTIAWFENETIHRGGAFSTAGAISKSALSPLSAFAADLDADGDLDALMASSTDDTVAWYENTDGRGSFGPEQAISTTAFYPTFVAAADIDGDGDPDAIVAALGDDTVAWYQNTDGLGSFGAAQIVSTTIDSPHTLLLADLDGDGDLDVVAQGGSELEWYENTDGQGGFGPEQIIAAISAGGARGVFAGDVDGDGDLDVLSSDAAGAAWFENQDGQGGFGPRQQIEALLGTGVFGADMDGDGDLDAVVASGSDVTLLATISWFENTDGLGSFDPGGTIDETTIPDFYFSPFASDIDRDGDLDLVARGPLGEVRSWFNLDGQGTFGAQQVIQPSSPFSSSTLDSVVLADLDADGDPDLLSASLRGPGFAWYENRDGLGTFSLGQTPVSIAGGGPRSVATADVDRDGDLDAFAAAEEGDWLLWNENSNGAGHFAFDEFISSTADGPVALVPADVDGDGDIDAISASMHDDTVAWWENTDGAGTFALGQTIWTQVFGATSLFAADLDGDSDTDILSTASTSGDILWHENTDGLGTFSTPHLVKPGYVLANSVFAADADRDGDLDVFSASSGDDTIAWFENFNGEGTFLVANAITTSAGGASDVFVTDMDGDGNLDVLAAAEDDDTIAWYENSDGLGSFVLGQTVSITAQAVTSATASDVDRDGDMDVVSSFSDTVAWYENLDGLGSFGPEQPITTNALGAEDVSMADIDGDGDLDALSAAFDDVGTVWYENRSGQVRFFTTATAPSAPPAGSLIELLTLELTHLGRAGDADAEVDTLALLFDGLPQTPHWPDPADPLTTAEGNALVENLFVYRDEGSGVFEPGSDALVATVASLTLDSGIQTIGLPTGDPDAQLAPGSSGLFFVVAKLEISGGTADPNTFRVVHLGSRSEVLHAGTSIALSQAPGTGTPSRPIAVPEPNSLLALAAGGALLLTLARRRTVVSNQKRVALAASALVFLGLPTKSIAGTQIINFEGITSLSELEVNGLTFSPNVFLWEGGPLSVLVDPDGGPVSPTFGICAGVTTCDGIGSIFFDSPLSEVSIYALSGPNPDLISAGTQIEAFDSGGTSLGIVAADDTLQFDRLTIQAVGIRRLELTSTVLKEAWDELEMVFAPPADPDGDGVLDDGDSSGVPGDNPCTGGATMACDDNCPHTANPSQADTDGDGTGDACDFGACLGPTINFEGLDSLADLAVFGVTFSPNIGLWGGGTTSVLDDPSGGPVSVTQGICAGQCGGEVGSIFFDRPQTSVSIYALSGPNPDLISAGTQIEAFDGAGSSLGTAVASSAIQFDLLTVEANGIRRLDLSSPVVGNEAWDDLTLQPGMQCVDAPALSGVGLLVLAISLLGIGLAVSGISRSSA